jgi:hypothetical protein
MNIQYLKTKDRSFVIKQSPNPDVGYVISDPEIITYWNYKYISKNKIVLLAHNYGSGKYFLDLKDGDIVSVDQNNYIVNSIRKFWATRPNSIYSDFIEDETGITFTNHDLFYEIYGSSKNELILQTCLEKNGNNKAGRLFITCILQDISI